MVRRRSRRRAAVAAALLLAAVPARAESDLALPFPDPLGTFRGVIHDRDGVPIGVNVVENVLRESGRVYLRSEASVDGEPGNSLEAELEPIPGNERRLRPVWQRTRMPASGGGGLIDFHVDHRARRATLQARRRARAGDRSRRRRAHRERGDESRPEAARSRRRRGGELPDAALRGLEDHRRRGGARPRQPRRGARGDAPRTSTSAAAHSPACSSASCPTSASGCGQRRPTSGSPTGSRCIATARRSRSSARGSTRRPIWRRAESPPERPRRGRALTRCARSARRRPPASRR